MTRLMSYWTIAMSAMKKQVMAPITTTKDSAVRESSNSGDMRATMKMPAVTIVAAWISAEMGVGPSIESGSQTCSGKWALRSESSNSGDMRATMKMPAVTIVAAWISAEMGVGPSIESGSQTCSGNWALFPIAPMNRQMQMTVIGIHG